jgi:hypothetical protein
MSKEVVGIRLSAGGYRHEHITHVWWTETGQSGSTPWTTEQMVRWIESGGSAYVSNGTKAAPIRVRTSDAGRKYLQTLADGIWSNNLLSLPRR